jgi:hypothetical protein
MIHAVIPRQPVADSVHVVTVRGAAASTAHMAVATVTGSEAKVRAEVSAGTDTVHVETSTIATVSVVSIRIGTMNIVPRDGTMTIGAGGTAAIRAATHEVRIVAAESSAVHTVVMAASTATIVAAATIVVATTRRGNDRDNNRGNGPRHDGGQNHGEYRRHDDRGGYGERNNHHDRGDRGGYQRRDERSTEHGGDNAQRLDKPRRNSDGTISFPSQNPYTDRRPGEPKMPKGMEWSMLSKDEKERLRGLSKEHAENVGLHMLAAYSIEEEEPELALEHAKWIARQASRIDLARETLAFIAYRQGDYKLALKEFRTAYRMNGYLDYLPFMADCERGLGNPRKAIEVASSEESKQLQGDAKAEMFLVYAGALGDLGLWDKAIETVHTLSLAKGLSGGYRMRAVQAEQNFLEQNGRSEDALALEPLLDKLEAQYADEDDEESSQDVAVDYDLEKLSDSELEQIGIEAEDGGFRRRS